MWLLFSRLLPRGDKVALPTFSIMLHSRQKKKKGKGQKVQAK